MEKFRFLAVSPFIMDKIVISMTPLITRNDENGITHLHLWRFLMADGL